MQERFLSTRILHFTTGKIYLETGQGIKSEDGYTSAELMRVTVNAINLLTAEAFSFRKPLSLQRCASFLFPLINPTQPSDESRTTTNATSPLEWFWLVEIYSTCALTNERDKLPALCGIAKIIHQTARSRYLAGIWADRLEIGLMWMNVGAPLKKANTRRASSWSWAAYDGPVQFPLSRFSLPYSVVCNLLRVKRYDSQLLSGPQILTIEADILNSAPILRSRDLFISLYREDLHPANARAWEQHELSALFQDPALCIFNIFHVCRLLWSGRSSTTDGKEKPSLQGAGHLTTTSNSFPRAEGSWIVFDNENDLPTNKMQNCSFPFCH